MNDIDVMTRSLIGVGQYNDSIKFMEQEERNRIAAENFKQKE